MAQRFGADKATISAGSVPDGSYGLIPFGTWPNVQYEPMWYYAAARSGAGAWIGKPVILTNAIDQSFLMSESGRAEWSFLNNPGSSTSVFPKFFDGGQIDYVGDRYAAGLKLQVKLSGRIKGTGTFSMDMTPFFYEYGITSADNKLSLNNDGQAIWFANQQSGSNTTTTSTQPLPADTTVAFSLPNCGSTAGFPASGTIVLLHQNFRVPVRLAYTSLNANGTQFDGCTRVGAGYTQLNNLSIPTATAVWAARLANFPPAGYNPDGLATSGGTNAGPGDGNIGCGPILNSGTAASIGIIASTGWQDVNFYHSFSSGEIDTTRPTVPTKRLMYIPLYARLSGSGAPIAQATTPSGQGGSTWLSLMARWVT